MTHPGIVWHPEMFHGRGWRSSGFDGWYFKVVDPSRAARVGNHTGHLDGPRPSQTVLLHPVPRWTDGSHDDAPLSCPAILVLARALRRRGRPKPLQPDVPAPGHRRPGPASDRRPAILTIARVADSPVGTRGYGAFCFPAVSRGVSRHYERRPPHRRFSLRGR